MSFWELFAIDRYQAHFSNRPERGRTAGCWTIPRQCDWEKLVLLRGIKRAYRGPRGRVFVRGVDTGVPSDGSLSVGWMPLSANDD